MYESESYEQPGRPSEYNRKGAFARFFRKHIMPTGTSSDDVHELDYTDDSSELSHKVDAKPDYFHPTIPQLSYAEVHEILTGIGVEQGANHLHTIHYVGGIALDSEPDVNETFADYEKKHNVKNSHAVASLYTGDLTKSDNAVIKKLLGYESRNLTDEQRQVEIDKLTQSGRTMMEETILPEHLSLNDALIIIQKDQLKPVAYYHNIEQYRDLREGEKVLFWIDDTFGGEINLEVGPTFNDSLAGAMANGEIKVTLQNTLVGRLDWNSWQSNALRWAVDPFLRSHILDENPDNQMYTQL